MNKGWVSIYRQVKDNWIWNHEPFTYGQAWIDLILSANHAEGKVAFKEEIILIQPGSFVTSEVQLMERWKWSKSRLRLFLTRLENDGMIIRETNRKRTMITIVNYSHFQNSKVSPDQQKSVTEPTTDQYEIPRVSSNVPEQSANEPTADINNNINNIINDDTAINGNKKKNYGKYSHVLLTQDEHEELGFKYGDNRRQELIEYLDGYFEEHPDKHSDSHFVAINRWVDDALKNQKKNYGSKNQFNNYQNSTSEQIIDEFEKILALEANQPINQDNTPCEQ